MLDPLANPPYPWAETPHLNPLAKNPDPWVESRSPIPHSSLSLSREKVNHNINIFESNNLVLNTCKYFPSNSVFSLGFTYTLYNNLKSDCLGTCNKVFAKMCILNKKQDTYNIIINNENRNISTMTKGLFMCEARIQDEFYTKCENKKGTLPILGYDIIDKTWLKEKYNINITIKNSNNIEIYQNLDIGIIFSEFYKHITVENALYSIPNINNNMENALRSILINLLIDFTEMTQHVHGDAHLNNFILHETKITKFKSLMTTRPGNNFYQDLNDLDIKLIDFGLVNISNNKTIWKNPSILGLCPEDFYCHFWIYPKVGLSNYYYTKSDNFILTPKKKSRLIIESWNKEYDNKIENRLYEEIYYNYTYNINRKEPFKDWIKKNDIQSVIKKLLNEKYKPFEDEWSVTYKPKIDNFNIEKEYELQRSIYNTNTRQRSITGQYGGMNNFEMEIAPINDLTKKLLLARSIYRATPSCKRPSNPPSYKTVSELIPYSMPVNYTTKQLLLARSIYRATPSCKDSPHPPSYRTINHKLLSRGRSPGRKATPSRGRSPGRKATPSRGRSPGRKATPSRGRSPGRKATPSRGRSPGRKATPSRGRSPGRKATPSRGRITQKKR